MMESPAQLPSGVSAAQALQLALGAMQEGRHDPRIADGAQANALESIAWSLIGLLSTKTEPAPAEAPTKGKSSMSTELQRSGLLQLATQR
jgi:hypothetical protein